MADPPHPPGPPAGPQLDYAIGRTPFGHFVTATRDTAIGGTVRNGHHFGYEEVDRAIELVQQHRPDWRPRHFIDIGSNIGTHIVYALRHKGFEDGMAFEIASENFMMLQCNLLLNGIDPARVARNHGLSSAEGTARIEKSPFNNGDFRVADGAAGENKHTEESWELEEVRVRTFDASVPEELLEANGTLVWIDTQGHEARVLDGARRLLEKRIPFAMEFWPYGIQRSGSDFHSLWQRIEGCTVLELRSEVEAIEPETLHRYYQQCLSEEGDGYSPHTDLLVLP